jgi:GH35 family endo-1,4-beta-xylanase
MVRLIRPELQSLIDQTLETRRKGDFRLRVTDSHGKPIAGAKVKVSLQKHAFLFGCTLPHRDWSAATLTDDQHKFLKLWEPLFSLVVPENSTKGRMWDKDPKPALSIHGLACQRGLKFKSHAPIWGSEIKEHLPNISFAGLDAMVRRRLKDQFAAFKGNHYACEVANELTADPYLQNRFGLKPVLDWYNLCRELDPAVKLSVNEYSQLDVRGPETAALVKEMKEAGVPVTIQAEQMHEPASGWFAPAEVWKMLDRMAANQVEVHLTEITQPDDGTPVVGGYRDGETWTSKVQADYYRELFTLGFGHAACESVVLWAFWDGSSWRKRGGIVELDFTPKLAYRALEDLIRREWQTELELVTDGEGKAAGRGFYGKYRLEAPSTGSGQARPEADLAKGQKNEWEIKV